jgi:hypothetical protein
MKKVLFGICALVLFTGCFATKSSNELKNKIDGNDAISLDYAIVNNSSIIVTAKNKSDKALDYVTLNLAIYDKAGKLIGVEKQYLRNLVANQENIIKIPLTDVGTNDDAKAAKVEIAVKTLNYENSAETAYTDKVEGTVEKTDNEGQLNLTITNNSGVTVDDLNAAVVFYKDSKVVDLYSVAVQKIGATYNDTVYVPVQNNSKENVSFIEYDDVKVIINNASVFNQ